MASRTAALVLSASGTSGSRTVSAQLPEHRQRVLGRRRIGLDEQRRVQRHQLVLQLERGGVVAPQAGALELGAQPRRHVRGHRDAAVAAMRH